MSKKFTMLLASLFLVMGTAWAQSELVKVGKPYTLKCQGSHKAFLQDDGEKFNGQGSTPTLFIFEAASDGKVYIKSEKTKKYLNAPSPANGSAISYDDQPSTAWTVGTLNGGLHFSAADKLYLNNAAGTNNLQIKQHDPITTGNGCSLWNTKETIELTTSTDDIKWYTIKNVRCGSYVYHNGDGGQMVLKGLTGASRNAGKFYFTGEKNEDGSLFTVKIHNAATTKLCKEYNSWDEDGIDWYIQFSENTANPGFAISKENDLTSDDYSWNDAGGNGTSVAYWNGNDPGSTWEFESVELELPEMSTMENPSFYYIRNVRHFGKYANYVAEGSRLTQVATPGLGSYWYFVAAGDAPEGWVACKIYNAANAKSLQNPSGTFNDAQVYYIKKHEWNGNIGFAIKRSTTDTNSTQDGWNDAGGNGQTIGDYYADDLGSIWWIEQAPKTAAELKSEAATALANAQAAIALYGEADYFTYPADAVATAKAAIEGLDVTSSLAAAVSGHITVNAALATMQSAGKNGAPAVGDYIRMKNRSHENYIYAHEDDNKVRGLNDKADTKTLWLVGGTEGAFKLKNFVSQTFISTIEQDVEATMVEEASAGEFTFSNVGEAYASVKTKDGGSYDCANFNTWYGGRVLGWTDNGDIASHWVFSQAYPLTVVYKYNDEELTDYKVSTFVDKGETYIVPEVTNTQAGFLAIESCTVNGQPLEAENGVWSVTMGANTDIEVTLKEVATVTDLSTLDNLGIYTLESERSPLMYSTKEGMTTKLSSGMVDGVSANVNDINQQFAILRTNDTPENYYYLYSLGADKFVDANLNFTDTPAPVLSFEPYKGANSEKYPWWVKISDKYVITGNGGEDGNKIYHIEEGDDDDGKRYRIGKVGSMDLALAGSLAYLVEASENVVKQLSELDNNKVYTVTAYERGQWYYNNEQSGALWSTGKNAIASGAAENVNHFAFLTVNGKTYLYSVGAQKFVVKSADNSPNDGTAFAAFSDVPTHSIDFITSNNAGFPVVVKFNGIESGASQLHISTGYKCPVILYDNPNAAASQVRILPVDTETPDLSSVIATIEDYQVNEEARGGLEALITEATTLLETLPEGLPEKETLSTAKDEAQAVLDQSEPAATYEQMMEKKEALATALAAVQEYPFINGMLKDLTAGSYLIYYTDGEGTRHYLKTSAANSVITVADNPEKYPMPYEVEVAGLNTNETKYQKAYTLKMNNLYISNTSQNASNIETKTAKNDWSTQAIFEKDGKCAIRLTNAIDNAQGWHGHWFIGKGDTEGTTIAKDPEVATLEELFIWTIEAYTKDEVQIAADELGEYLAQLPAERNIAPGVNNYSQPAEDRDFDEAKAEVQDFYNAITRTTTVAEINEKKAYLEDLESRITINMPENGKFYRVRCAGSGMKYLQSTLDESNPSDIRLKVLSDATGVDATFCYVDGALLSYTTGLYINAYRFNEVGVKSNVVFTEASNGKVGRYNIEVGGRYIFGVSDANKIDSGTGTPDNRDGYTWWLEEVTSLPVTVTSAGWATLYAPVALEIPVVDGLKVYTAAIDIDNGYVNLTEVEGNVIPAETGVMIKAPAETYNFAVTTTTDELESDFVGSFAKSNMQDGVKTYTLQAPDGKVGFYRFKGTQAINGFRAWVEVENASGAQAFRIRFAGETTGIDNVELDGETVIFDLTGRRIEKIVEKGIYIVNGKKVVIK